MEALLFTDIDVIYVNGLRKLDITPMGDGGGVRESIPRRCHIHCEMGCVDEENYKIKLI